MTPFDLLIESHLNLERLGPGNDEATLKALSFINKEKIAKILDLGCGTGGQTFLLAQATNAEVLGVDLVPAFVEIFNQKAKQKGLNKVKAEVGNITNLSFEKESFDLLWCEGVIDQLGFARSLAHWQPFLKEDGYIAVTMPSWFSDQRPKKVSDFWQQAGSAVAGIEEYVATLQKEGYQFVASFALPSSCWTTGYYNPREKACQNLLTKYPNNPVVTEFVQSMQTEATLYQKYGRLYGYAFYIIKKR